MNQCCSNELGSSVLRILRESSLKIVEDARADIDIDGIFNPVSPVGGREPAMYIRSDSDYSVSETQKR